MNQRFLTCVNCGHCYPIDTPAFGSDVLTSHIRQCERHPMRRLQEQIAAIRKAIENIVCTDDVDGGVLLLSTESPTHYNAEQRCDVYDHEHFSELGGALIKLWKLTEPVI